MAFSSLLYDRKNTLANEFFGNANLPAILDKQRSVNALGKNLRRMPNKAYRTFTMSKGEVHTATGEKKFYPLHEWSHIKTKGAHKYNSLSAASTELETSVHCSRISLRLLASL